MAVCNSTLSDEVVHEAPLWKGFTFHHFGLFLAAVFGLVALVIGLFLMLMHATHYLKPWEQKHIIRILLLIPVYSTVSFLSYLFYQHAIYYDILEGCYEAFAISSFFTLLCHYVAPNLHDQKDYFRTMKPKNWFWKFWGLQYCFGGENKGPFRKPRSGLTWFNIIFIGVFQYCFIRVLFTIVAVVAQIGDVYCQDSLSPAFAHVWVEVFEAVSVSIAMFCLIQFYIQLKDDLAEHKPFLKVLCIKLVIFFSFWQTIVISFLSSSNGPLKTTKYIGYPDIKVGIPSVLLCIEMAIFAVMHIFAFPWKPYSIKHSYSDPLNEPGSGFSGGGEGLSYKGVLWALADSFNPWDIIKMTARGFRWLFVGVRHREEDASYRTPSKLGLDPDATAYQRPPFPGPNEAATELRDGRGRSDTAGTVEDDRAGLLNYQGRMGQGRMHSASPYRSEDYANPAASSRMDPSTSARQNRPQPRSQYQAPPGITSFDFGLDSKPSDFSSSSEDPSYHQQQQQRSPPPPRQSRRSYQPDMDPGSAAGRRPESPSVHPAFRRPGHSRGGSWELGSNNINDAESVAGRPPPSYRTYDAHG